MILSTVWEEIVRECRYLDEREREYPKNNPRFIPLRASGIYTDPDTKYGEWALVDGMKHMREEFKLIATKAAHELGSDAGAGFEFWLHHLLNRPNGAGRRMGGPRDGTIPNVLRESVSFASEFATRAREFEQLQRQHLHLSRVVGETGEATFSTTAPTGPLWRGIGEMLGHYAKTYGQLSAHWRADFNAWVLWPEDRAGGYSHRLFYEIAGAAARLLAKPDQVWENNPGRFWLDYMRDQEWGYEPEGSLRPVSKAEWERMSAGPLRLSLSAVRTEFSKKEWDEWRRASGSDLVVSMESVAKALTSSIPSLADIKRDLGLTMGSEGVEAYERIQDGVIERVFEKSAALATVLAAQADERYRSASNSVRAEPVFGMLAEVDNAMLPGQTPEPTQHLPLKRKRGRPASIPLSAKQTAMALRDKREPWKTVAQALYQTHYPTSQQIRNAPNVLKHYRKTNLP